MERTKTVSRDYADEAARKIAEDDALFHDCNCEAVVCAEHVQPRIAAIIRAAGRPSISSERLQADIDAFWAMLDRCWDIEPREYFEAQIASGIGFDDSPLAMAVHYMWKREAKPAPSSREAGIREAAAAICQFCAKPDVYKPAAMIEGSRRLWHQQRNDSNTHFQCEAAAALALLSPAEGKERVN